VEKKVADSHSAVFPEMLVKTIIENFSNPNDLVYDPFMGTGTTAFVAKKLNRNYIGSELNKKYFDVISQRMECFSEVLL